MSRILIIEDDPSVRDLLGRVLVDESHEVVTAPDGQVGIDLCRQRDYDLVITDIYMPTMDGLETITELRRAFPDVKIVAVSGKAGGRFDPLSLARKLGASHTLTKPIALDELLVTVRELLRP